MEGGTFGKYEVVSWLGRGGMAEAFRCRLGGIGGFEKDVVIKRIHPERAQDPDFLRMFLDEARLAAGLNHPNIAQIYEVGEVSGAPYIAMEYVAGPTLQSLIREAQKTGRVHYGHFARVLAGVCEGLSYAHRACARDGTPLHIVHRDVTPHNIIVSFTGPPKLVDFGIAKAKGRVSNTEAGTLKGKLRYMAPEQMTRAEIDHRVDIFSLGVCLCEATTGNNPFGSADLNDVAVFTNILHGTLTRPSEQVADFPAELEQIILRAISPDPDTRYQSAQELGEDLLAFASRAPHASSSDALSEWLSELFPGQELTLQAQLTRRQGTRANAATLALPPFVIERDLTTPDVQPPMFADAGATPSAQRVRRQTGYALPLLVACALLMLGAFALRTQKSHVSAATARPQPPAMPVVVAGDELSEEAAARAYLDEAERMLSFKAYAAARELLEQVRELHVREPALNIRLARLSASLEVAVKLLRAQQALATGRPRDALDVAREVIELEPQNAEALAIIARAQPSRKSASEAHEAASVTRPEPVVAAPLPPTPAPVVATAPQPTAAAPVVASNPPPAQSPLPASTAPAAKAQPGVATTRERPSATSAIALKSDGTIPVPYLPRVQAVAGDAELARVLGAVEGQVITRAGIAPDFARGITAALRRSLTDGGHDLYPVAMYYFLVREAALGHTRLEASQNLARAQENRELLLLRDLPAKLVRL